MTPDRVEDAIAPHGGVLVDREAAEVERARWEREAARLPAIRLDRRALSDLEMIVIGGFSPLDGFMGEADHASVVDRMRLASGVVWTIPVTLGVGADQARRLAVGADVALQDEAGTTLAILHLRETYRPDKRREVTSVYGTDDPKHPGVAAVLAQGEVYLGGRVTLLRHPADLPFPEHRLTPRQTRAAFRARGWKRIVAFQTRNPVHRAHEYIQKCALEMVDGLLLHPLVGETKGDDIPAEVRMECYRVLLDRYYPSGLTAARLTPRPGSGGASSSAAATPRRGARSRVPAPPYLSPGPRTPRPHRSGSGRGAPRRSLASGTPGHRAGGRCRGTRGSPPS